MSFQEYRDRMLLHYSKTFFSCMAGKQYILDAKAAQERVIIKRWSRMTKKV